LKSFGLRQALDQIAKFPSTTSLARVFLAPDIYRFPQGMPVSPQLCETRMLPTFIPFNNWFATE
jgi:hypothetical protein